MEEDDSPEENADYVPFSQINQLVIARGRPVFEQGAPAFQAYYIESGRIEISVQENSHVIKLAELGPGEIFGEMGVLENETRMASAIALETTTVNILTRKDLEMRIDAIEDVYVRALITSQSKRLRAANRGQMQYYRHMAELQDRLIGLARGVEDGINASKRDEFTKDIAPLMAEMEKIIRKYQG